MPLANFFFQKNSSLWLKHSFKLLPLKIESKKTCHHQRKKSNCFWIQWNHHNKDVLSQPKPLNREAIHLTRNKLSTTVKLITHNIKADYTNGMKMSMTFCSNAQKWAFDLALRTDQGNRTVALPGGTKKARTWKQVSWNSSLRETAAYKIHECRSLLSQILKYKT